MPIALRQQYLLHQVETRLGIDASQHDGQIPGYTVRPQGRGSQCISAEDGGGSAQRCVRVQHPIGKHLKLLRLKRVHTQLEQTRRRPSGRQALCPVERRWVAVLLGEDERLGVCLGEEGPESNSRSLSGRDTHSPPQRQHRIEHCA